MQEKKKKTYLLNIINKITIKQNKEVVRHETIPIRVIIRKYIKEISLDIIKISLNIIKISLDIIKISLDIIKISDY
jgi:hypothetical protein